MRAGPSAASPAAVTGGAGFMPSRAGAKWTITPATPSAEPCPIARRDGEASSASAPSSTLAARALREIALIAVNPAEMQRHLRWSLRGDELIDARAQSE